MNVLCVVAHPDDEVLGCGGTLAKHAANGDHRQVLVLCNRGLVERTQDALAVLGVPTFRYETFPDQRLDTLPLVDLVAAISVTDLDGWEPDIIYTHHPAELNLDHAITARAVLTAFRPKPGEKARTILACEVLSSTEWTFPQQFQPNWFEKLDWIHVSKKIEALRCYPTEIQKPPHPRSSEGVETLIRYRGQQAGVEYAEAFQLLRRGPC